MVFITYLLGIAASFCLNFIKVENPLWAGAIDSIKITTVLSIFWSAFFAKLWRIPGFNKIFHRIDLNGTWFGSYESTNISSEEVFTGDIAIRISQDFLNIHITSFTEKYKNFSYSEELRYDEKSESYGLVYTYSQKESNIHELSQRNGTSDLLVLLGEGKLRIEGEFWTVFGTRGTLRLRKITKAKLNSFSEAQNLANQTLPN